MESGAYKSAGGRLMLAHVAESHWATRLLRAFRFATGKEESPRLFETTWETDRDFVAAVSRAYDVQRAGYDLRLAFIPRFPDAPAMHLCTGRIGLADFTAAGNDFDSRALAVERAISETMERWLWGNVDFWSEKSVRSDFASMRAPCVDPILISGFSVDQRRDDPRLRYDDRRELSWTKCVDLASGSGAYVPTQLVSEKYARAAVGRAREPILRMPTSNGLATHRSYDQAALSGMLELIERDAFMITYYNRISAPRIDPSSIQSVRIRELLAEFERFTFQCDLLVLPTDMPVHVVCCILRDETGVGPALSIGARARFDTEEAIMGALAEAYSVWIASRTNKLTDMLMPSRPWGIVERLAFWAKRENLAKASWLWAGEAIAAPQDAATLTVRSLALEMKKRGSSVYALPMSPVVIRALGVHSVCVCSPELQPLNLESDPDYRGGERLRTIPTLFNYKFAIEPPQEPHPFP